MRRKIALQRRYMIAFGLLWAVICLILIIAIKDRYFIGITENDVTYVSQVTPVEYEVQTIRQNTQTDGSTTYKVTFDAIAGDAPVFAVDLYTLPTDLTLGNVYTAQWLQVVGTAEGYTRSKDMVSIQFAEQNLDNTAITQLRADIYNALSEILEQRLDVLFYPFCIFALLILLLGEYFIVRFSALLVNKFFVPNEWDYLQESIDKRSANSTRSSLDFTEELQVLRDLVQEQTKQEHKRDDVQLVELKTHAEQCKASKTDETAPIVVQKSTVRQNKAPVMKRPAKKIVPIQEDIIVSPELLKRKR